MAFDRKLFDELAEQLTSVDIDEIKTRLQSALLARDSAASVSSEGKEYAGESPSPGSHLRMRSDLSPQAGRGEEAPTPSPATPAAALFPSPSSAASRRIARRADIRGRRV